MPHIRRTIRTPADTAALKAIAETSDAGNDELLTEIAELAVATGATTVWADTHGEHAVLSMDG